MDIKSLKLHILDNLKDKTKEIKRVFHGRGNFYKDFNYLTIDSINNILFASLFESIDITIEEEIKTLLLEISNEKEFDIVILQRRYINKTLFENLKGEIPKNIIAYENGLKYNLSFSNKNIGLFFDMKKGREYIHSISKDKKVLNLFSYTCAFSVCAIENGALKVVNVDMAKGALSVGRENHRINNHDTFKVQFMPYNILKSWNRIKKAGPYDIIIIDPPSFQKGSFAATKDYEKIIKKLVELSTSEAIILSALNAPELSTSFIINLFKSNAKEFKYIKRLDNLPEFISIDEEKSLKNLIFKRVIND